MKHLTGLRAPDRHETRTRQLATKRLGTGAALPRVCVPPYGRIRRQPRLPNCGGESLAGAIHGLAGFDPSGRDLWADSVRRDLGYFDPESGTLLEYVVESAMLRGVSPYREDEEYDTSANGPGWQEDLGAHDRRHLDATHYRIEPGDLTGLRTAIASGMAVIDGGGVTEKLMNRGPKDADTPAGLDELGGEDNGHAQRIRAYWWGSPVGDVLLYQGSWDVDFAGCWVPVLNDAGEVSRMEWTPGHFWAKAETFAGRWDSHCLDVSRVP